MKLKYLFFFILVGISVATFGGDIKSTLLEFIAPSVISADSLSEQSIGQIVYDHTTQSFRGLDQNGIWQHLNQNTLTKVDPAKYQQSIALSQNVSTDTMTIVNFDTKIFDDDNLVTTGSSWKYTVPQDGYYQVSAIVTFARNTNWNLADETSLYVFVNNANKAALDWIMINASEDSHNPLLSLNGTTTVKVSADDEIDIRVTQNSGITQVIYGDIYGAANIFKID